ncbi:type I restriction enzyme HsdR N-terminal domain-containing protein [Novosphingobium sp. 9]|uniref:type I restriction enzyme HsdR N-terminal domain-containing protein n=1 Tax=Novosphingobium sp. 9 TaxID=2025349 RepID=UPI0021B6A222|nr:type I restriction enzyme HsdR N-terminal domain-containing protein [Novosphingobium sp. 9]
MDLIASYAIAAGPTYNETEVRYYLIDPLIRHLGYGEDETSYLDLERVLKYPYFHIGRRSGKDVPLGKADYLAGLKGARGSFVVEAKAGSVAITNLEVEQAHSYAAHAQVGANYFLLCNGHELRIYETLSGPSAQPVVAIPIAEVNQRFHEIENILSKVNLARLCKVEYDRGLKLCNGLGSAVNLRSGFYKIIDQNYRIFVDGEDHTQVLRANLPQIAQMEQQLEQLKNVFILRVESGRLERDENGRILARAQMSGATEPNRQGMEMMGIDQLSFTTAAKFISIDADNLTLFETIKDFSIPQGTLMPQLMGEVGQMANTVDGGLFLRIWMYFNGQEIIGEFHASSHYDIALPVPQSFRMEIEFTGTFKLVPDL